MSRRSTRLQAKVAEQNAPSPPAHPSSSVIKAQPPAKKRKLEVSSDNVEGASKGDKGPSATKVKHKRGSLKMVLDMPVDVLLEVFQHLDPVDLLNLAKTDRTFRAYLLKRSVALPWWKAVSNFVLLVSMVVLMVPAFVLARRPLTASSPSPRRVLSICLSLSMPISCMAELVL